MTTINLVPFAGVDMPSDAVINTCVHCGLCLSSCPTYRETGLEQFSPRGRIYLMKAVADGRIGMESDTFQEQMSACLNCRACEAVCPSGVQYGQILEASRTQIHNAKVDGTLPPYPVSVRAIRSVVFGQLFTRMSLFRGFSRLLWLYQKSGLQWLARKLGIIKALGLAEAEAILPAINNSFTTPHGQTFPAIGVQKGHVALLSGCIMSTAFSNVHDATIRVLQRNGIRVTIPANKAAVAPCTPTVASSTGPAPWPRPISRRLGQATTPSSSMPPAVVRPSKNMAICSTTMPNGAPKRRPLVPRYAISANTSLASSSIPLTSNRST